MKNILPPPNTLTSETRFLLFGYVELLASNKCNINKELINYVNLVIFYSDDFNEDHYYNDLKNFVTLIKTQNDFCIEEKDELSVGDVPLSGTEEISRLDWINETPQWI